MKQYIVKNSNGHYLYKIKNATGWYYFTDNKDRAKTFDKEEATKLAKQFNGEVERNE